MFILFQAGIYCKWINDSQRFLLEHFDIIRNTPSYIYHYALQFSPPISWLHKYYTAELSQEVRVVKGIPAEWGACSRTVPLEYIPSSLAHWKDIIAVGLSSGEITILNAITGSQVAILSGHIACVRSLTFSLDGVLLASGGDDKTVKLWDVQTGGIIKTFYGHTHWVLSVSISPDCTTIASGSHDNTICLWHTQTGKSFCVINGHSGHINSVGFSPTNPRILISASNDHTIQQWSINGCNIGPLCEGDGIAFSLDGTHFVSWRNQVAIVQNSDSRVVAELQVPSHNLLHCCFSPDGKYVAGATGHSIYVWNLLSLDPHPVETFIGHTDDITSLTFPSSLISASKDYMVKFWQIGATLADPVASDTISTPVTPSPIESVSLQARDGLVISSNSAGVVKTWDTLTGHCRGSFQTPAIGRIWRDAQIIEGRLIFVWHQDQKIYIWDTEEGEFLHKVDTHKSRSRGLRISGDGSKVFCLIGRFIQAWSILTGEAVGEVELEDDACLDPLCADGSRIWVCFTDSLIQGWDFGTPGSSPILVPNTLRDRSHLNFIGGTREWNTGTCMVKDTVTGKVLFPLVGRYAEPTEVQWDGQYLVAGYTSGEVLILDFNHALLQ